MSGDAKATAFVTEPDGFIGSELIELLTSRGHQVLADIRTDAAFPNVRLHGTGFRFTDPAVDRGIQQVVGAARW
jgi:nucleoside-diphosphate-sugar epimerase